MVVRGGRSAPTSAVRREARARSRLVALMAVASVTATAAAACGVILDDSIASPPAGDADAGDSQSTTDDAGQSGDAPDGTAPAACREPGPPAVDTSFGPRVVPLVLAKMALDPAGRVVFVGRSDCGDAGEPALSIRALFPDAGDAPFSVSCFGDLEVPYSFQATANGYVLATLSSSPTRARIRRLDAEGTQMQLAQTIPSGGVGHVPTFALELGGSVVWGGYRSASASGPVVGYVSLVTGTSVGQDPSFPDMIPLTAAVEDQTLYVAFAPDPSSGAPKHLVLRRFSTPGGALLEDVTYSNNGRSRLEGIDVAAARIDGLGSMIVRDGVVTIAVPQAGSPGVVTVFQFDGDRWSPLATLIGATLTAHVTTACDGVVTVGHGNPARLSRLELDGGAAPLELVDGGAQVAGLARAADGSMLVLVDSGGQRRVLRVRP